MKNLKNLGQDLSKAEQKLVTGGKLPAPVCETDEQCGNDIDYTDPFTGARTCYNVYCGFDKQCHMTIC